MEDKQLLNLFTDMSRVHTAYVEHRLVRYGLHVGQGAVISAVGDRGVCSQKELAEYRRVSAATISVMLRRMEKNGVILRTPSEDGKCNQISLTEEGWRLYRILSRDIENEPKRVFAGLTDEEKETACRVFRKISDNLVHLTEFQ